MELARKESQVNSQTSGQASNWKFYGKKNVDRPCDIRQIVFVDTKDTTFRCRLQRNVKFETSKSGTNSCEFAVGIVFCAGQAQDDFEYDNTLGAYVFWAF